jgi:hypothetical protein
MPHQLIRTHFKLLKILPLLSSKRKTATLDSQMSMCRKNPLIDPGKDDTGSGSGASLHRPLTVSGGLHLPIELRRLVTQFGLKAVTIPTDEQFALIMLPFINDGPQKPGETFDAYRLRVNRATVNMGVEHRFVPKYLAKHEFPTKSAYDKARGNHQSWLKCRQRAHRNMLDPKHSTFDAAYVEKWTAARKERHTVNALRRHNALERARNHFPGGEELLTPEPPECSDDELWDWNSRGPIATDPNSRIVRADRKHETISPHERFRMAAPDSEVDIPGSHDMGPAPMPITTDTPVTQTPHSGSTTTRPAARRRFEKTSTSRIDKGTRGRSSTTVGRQPSTAPRRRPDIPKNPTSCNNCERKARHCDGKRPCDSCRLWREVQLCDASNENTNISMMSHSQRLSGYNPGYIQPPAFPAPPSSLVNLYVAEGSPPTYDAVQEPDWTSTAPYSPTWMSTGTSLPNSDLVDPDPPRVARAVFTSVSAAFVWDAQPRPGPLILLLPKPVFPDIKETRVPSDVRDLDATKCCDEVTCKVNPNAFYMDELLETENRYCESVPAKACDHLEHGNHYSCQECHDQQAQYHHDEEDGYPHGVVRSTKAFFCDECTYAVQQKYRSRQGVAVPQLGYCLCVSQLKHAWLCHDHKRYALDTLSDRAEAVRRWLLKRNTQCKEQCLGCHLKEPSDVEDAWKCLCCQETVVAHGGMARL